MLFVLEMTLGGLLKSELVAPFSCWRAAGKDGRPGPWHAQVGQGLQHSARERRTQVCDQLLPACLAAACANASEYAGYLSMVADALSTDWSVD